MLQKRVKVLHAHTEYMHDAKPVLGIPQIIPDDGSRDLGFELANEELLSLQLSSTSERSECMYMYTYTYRFIWIRIRTGIGICTYACLHECTYACTHAWIDGCMEVGR